MKCQPEHIHEDSLSRMRKDKRAIFPCNNINDIVYDMNTSVEKMSQILRASLTFQYSSAASMYILDGQCPPKKFGSNCYEQARSLRRELIGGGFDQTYFIEDTYIGRHRSLICLVNGKRYYFNPYFMHYGLIDVDTINPKNSFASYPTVNNVNSLIEVSRDNDILTVTKQWPMQQRVDKFIFDTNKLITKELDFENYYSRAFHPEQATLAIRFLNTDTGTVDYLAHSPGIDGENDTSLFIKTNENEKIIRSDSMLFDKKLEELTLLISSSPKETLDFLYGAINLHKKFKTNKPTFPKGPVPFPYE